MQQNVDTILQYLKLRDKFILQLVVNDGNLEWTRHGLQEATIICAGQMELQICKKQ